jgi:hypothetical protein
MLHTPGSIPSGVAFSCSSSKSTKSETEDRNECVACHARRALTLTLRKSGKQPLSIATHIESGFIPTSEPVDSEQSRSKICNGWPIGMFSGSKNMSEM